MYRNKVTGETRFLLDERLGLEERARVSPGLKEMVVNLAMQLSFRRVGKVLTEMTPVLSPMTAWSIVKEAGEQARVEGQQLRERVLERGEDPGGKERADFLLGLARAVQISL